MYCPSCTRNTLREVGSISKEPHGEVHEEYKYVCPCGYESIHDSQREAKLLAQMIKRLEMKSNYPY